MVKKRDSKPEKKPRKSQDAGAKLSPQLDPE
jgi:hypothetical protein